MRKGLGISGMKRPALGVVGTPEATAAGTTEVSTPMARRGIALSGAGRRLGISGMNRPTLTTTTATTATSAPAYDPDGELLP